MPSQDELRADDDEDVTEEWLLSVGLELHTHLGPHKHGRWSVRFYPHSGSAEICCVNDQPYYGWDESWDVPCTTRGDVRRLCAALGIELRSTPRESNE